MKKTISHLMSIVISLTLMLGWYANAGARAVKTVYVNPSGSDSNSGSATSPYKTLSKGVSVLAAGDTLVVSGTYSTTLNVTKSGTATAPITIIGNGAVLNVNGAGTGITVSGNYVNISGFEVTGAVSHGVLLSGKHLRFENSSVHNNLPGNGGAGNCVATSWGSGVKIMVGGEDILVKGNQVYENCGEGIAATRGLNIVVDGNTVRDNLSVNIYLDNSPYSIAQNNVVSCTGIYLSRDGKRPSGIALGEEYYSGWGAHRHDNSVLFNSISNCELGIVTFFGNFSGGAKNILIADNYVPSGIRRGISILSVNENVRVENNKIFNSIYTANPGGVTLVNNQIISGSVTPAPTSISPTVVPTKTVVPTQTVVPTTIPGGQASLDVRVAGGADDVEESASGWMYLDSSDLELVYDANTQTVGLRFNGVNIPKNAVILNAYVQFTADVASASATALTVQGLKTPNAAAFTTTPRDLSSRARTTASVNWTPASWVTSGASGAEQRTPNMASVIQEIVNQTGWTPGNSIAVIVSGNGKRVAKSYEGNAAKASLLHIEYTTSAALVVDLPQTDVTATPVPSLPSATPTYAPPTATLEATPQPVLETVYDDTSDSLVYSSDWVSLDASQAYGGTYKATTTPGASVTMEFTGQSFSVLYTDGQIYKGMAVYVDGVLVETVLRKADVVIYQQRWDYPGVLEYGTHTVQLVFANGNGTLDAVIVR